MTKIRQIYLKKAGNKPIWDHRIQNGRANALKHDEVRIKVHYSGLNFADVMMKLGLYPDAPSTPYIPGYEVSGVVTEIGAGIEDLAIGQKICAGLAFGGYQSEVVLPRWQVVALPSHLSMKEGAGLIVSFITAYASFHQMARVKPSDRVFIDCATGALGHLSLALLKSHGVEKIYGATRSPEKLKFLRDQGIAAFTHQQLREMKNPPLFDLILNSRGGQSLREDYQRLSPMGRMVCIGASSFIAQGRKKIFSWNFLKNLWAMRGFSPVSLMNDNRAVMGLNALRLFDSPELLQESLKFLEQDQGGNMIPYIDKVFAADELELALDYLGQGHSRGKVLLKW